MASLFLGNKPPFPRASGKVSKINISRVAAYYRLNPYPIAKTKQSSWKSYNNNNQYSDDGVVYCF